ncbi:MAG: hypothetical protein ABIH76_05160 [Candidatus Bathyarchaeota archaeon]
MRKIFWGMIMDINDAFRSTCKIVLGDEIGELKDYQSYLSEPLIGKYVTSHFSKKKVFMTSEQYCKDARFFDYGKEYQLFEKSLSKPININEIKDIDSLFLGVKEKILYSGNKVTGKSLKVEESDDVVDGIYVLNSSMVDSGKYLAYSCVMEGSNFTFGTTSSADSNHLIRCFYNLGLRRSFESVFSNNSSNCYFCYNAFNSNECMFTFNVRSKRHMVGNLQLEPSRYSELKDKLLNEIRDELKRKKRLDFSIVNIHRAGGVKR